MQQLVDFTRRFGDDYKAWHGSNLYRKGSELVLGTYREEEIINLDDTPTDQPKKFKHDATLAGKFICVNKNVQINDSVLSLRRSTTPKVVTQVQEYRPFTKIVNLVPEQNRSQTTARQRRDHTLGLNGMVTEQMDKGLRGRIVKNKYSSLHTQEEFGLPSDLEKVSEKIAHPESMMKRTTTNTIGSKQIQPDRFEIDPWTKPQSDASSTLREFKGRP